ncbi:MAG: mannose-phosphate guanylyltransferase [Gammaproteobacteria bacterium]|nr:mannose-phosphate guanylyltransferase [Gammaproteobacteria bacterium]
MTEPWCVLLASREDPQRPRITAYGEGDAPPQASPSKRDPLTATLRRAATVTSLGRIAAIIAAPSDQWRQSSFKDLGIRNLFVQPKHQGTGYEVLLALLLLENRISPATPVLFLPADHTVNDEEVMTNTLMTMAEWIADEPGPVYLLGAVPQGPHDQLGYIVPRHDAMLMPTGVYEFVERPDVRRARKLINAGGLWNTFIFGGNVASLIKLFRPRFDTTIAALRAALQSDHVQHDLVRIYDGLTPVDFSQDLLAKQTERLKVLRLLRCGWWPLKSPALDPQLGGALASRLEADSGDHEKRLLAASPPSP